MSNAYLALQKNKGAVFDLSAMNAKLAADTGVGELLDYDQVPPGSEFFKIGGSKGLLIMDRESGAYLDEANVYACWGESEMKAMASFITAGELVLRFTSEGWEPSYWSIKPGKIKEVDPF